MTVRENVRESSFVVICAKDHVMRVHVFHVKENATSNAFIHIAPKCVVNRYVHFGVVLD